MKVLLMRVLPWVRFAAPVVVKKVRDVKSNAGAGVGFVQKWEVASWKQQASGWAWSTDYAGSSRVKSAMAARKARAATGTVRVTYRGR